jgi:hypothetical protein
VSKAKNATFLFHRDFMEYHQDRFDDFSLMVFKDDKLVGILPANIQGNTVYSHQGLTYGGLLVEAKMKLNDFIHCFSTILEYSHKSGFQGLYIKILPSIYNVLPNDELEYLMFVLNAQLERRDALSVVDMTHKIEISRDRKAGCKRAKKQGLEIREDNNFELFWNKILIPNLELKHQAKPVHELNEIKLLCEKFPNNIRQFNVYKDGEIVAGTTIFETEQVAHSQYISGNQDKNTLGSLDFLHYELINNVFNEKQYFDFGISNEDQGKKINKGLNYWKEGFGARTIMQSFYLVKTKNYGLLKDVMI